MGRSKTLVKNLVTRLGFAIVRADHPALQFHSDHYIRHNARRLEHLASLGIPVAGSSVLEVGAGIGDHSHYYLDRGCTVTITEARPENLRILRRRYPECEVRTLDMERPALDAAGPFDVVHCYGLLYHLADPEQALAFLSRNTQRLLLLETCVSFGADEAIHPTAERQRNPTQAWSGTGCRPTRSWVFEQLRRLFEHVYVPSTQPNHAEFPLDWTAPEQHPSDFARAVFIGSRQPMANACLLPELPDRQQRHA
jgi:SAM-dependent methyltransferase